MSLWQLLQQAQTQKLLRPLDVQFARLLADDSQPTLMLAAALTSRDSGDGHVCLALDQLSAESCFAGQHLPLAQQLFTLAGDPAHWRDRLLRSTAVSEGEQATPLKLVQQRLYLYRLWHNERRVIGFFRQQNHSIEVEQAALRALLNRLFPAQHPLETDWQKIAVAVALTRRIAVISGGPGTGKTTTVARLLQAILALQSLPQTLPENSGQAAGLQGDDEGTAPDHTALTRQIHTTPPADTLPDKATAHGAVAPVQPVLRIRLAAPTGKAAARLSESLGGVLRQCSANSAVRVRIEEACTLHRLLGVQQGRSTPRYHAANPLHLDILLIDEASMIDLPMMARLIEALPAHARLILLGDHDQLASVEAGAVLGDLCHYAHTGYSAVRAAQLSQLTGYQIDGDPHLPPDGLRDSVCLLRKSYRFQADSGIGQLASAVNRDDSAAVRGIFAQPFSDLQHSPLNSPADYQAMLNDALAGYQHYLSALQDEQLQSATPDAVWRALQAFGKYQLLCAIRQGDYGVSGLNQRLENALHARRLIRRRAEQRWYHGRPVMISRNDRVLGLYNGDTGIALQQSDGRIRVWFALPDGELKSIAPGRLPEHETAWAMTVHKAQGSEFDHVALILPPQHSPLMTRELVYTAITRARQRLSLYTDVQILLRAIACRTKRHSGLLQGIQGG